MAHSASDFRSSTAVNKVELLGLCRDTRTHRAQRHAAIRMVSMQTGVLWKTKRVSRPTGAIVLRSRSRDVHAESRGHMVARLAHHTAVTTVIRGPGAMWRVGPASSTLGVIAARRKRQAPPSRPPRPLRPPQPHSQPRLPPLGG